MSKASKQLVYVVNLRRTYWGRRSNRADRAVRLLKDFISRHVKANKVIVYNEVNNVIWSRGREKPPARLKVLVEVREEKGEGESPVKVALVKLAPENLRPGPLS
ncbi:MAG: 50S ribosomal protein L31e [Acidilobaceae archaeon]